MMRRILLLLAVVSLIGCRNVELPEEVTFLRGNTAEIYIDPKTGLTTNEAGGVATFQVSLVTKPTAAVTLTLTSSNTNEGQMKRSAGTCDNTGSVAATSCTLTFTPENFLTTQTVGVVGQNDDSVDANTPYTITVTVASSDTAYNGLSVPAIQLTNTDNDTAGFVATPSSGLVTRPSGVGATATTQIKLSSKPTANVTFSVKSDDTAGGDVTTPAGKSFTFTTANWNTAQNLVITGGATTPVDYKIVIDGSVTSTDTNYAGITGTVLHSGISVKNIAASDRYIFFTSSAYSGNLGGASGADAKCNAAGNKPNGSTYKAIIGGGGRTACTTASCGGGPSEHTDWVLLPSQRYTRSDGTEIGTTNASGIFAFPLTNGVGGSSSPWTGLSTSWTTASACSNWASTSGTGIAGLSSSNTSTMLDAGFGGGFGLSCSSLYPIYCAEQ